MPITRTRNDFDAQRPDLPSTEADRSADRHVGSAYPSVPGYEILGELGRGGMGVVYKARQVGLNRVVALKMVRPGKQVTAKKLARFDVEAKAVAQLQHPNIVQIFEVGRHDSKPFFSMEYVGGGTLAERLYGESYRPRAAAKLVATLARTIQAVHERGLLHRDLKPSNILLTEDGTPKITDFGLAKHLDGEAQLTNPGETLGTPGYMAPEQVNGDLAALGPATDIYALGAILYALLAGRPPFEGDTMLVLSATVNQLPTALRKLKPGVPAQLEAICLKCLEKNPAARYSSCQELAEELQRVKESRTRQEKTATRRAPAGSSRRKPHTHKVLLWSMWAVLVALITVVAMTLGRDNNMARGGNDAQLPETPAKAGPSATEERRPDDWNRSFEDRGPPPFRFRPKGPPPGFPPPFPPPPQSVPPRP